MPYNKKKSGLSSPKVCHYCNRFNTIITILLDADRRPSFFHLIILSTALETHVVCSSFTMGGLGSTSKTENLSSTTMSMDLWLFRNKIDDMKYEPEIVISKLNVTAI